MVEFESVDKGVFFAFIATLATILIIGALKTCRKVAFCKEI